ncbi:hypothetical protein RBB77_08375 [Tunturibacter psychrotolerans]|uniref:Uncharacterized protein n=1 Tax=Tunturiibacter psychrotolerans TaxID=3069686 RepID=A0AAU7ZV44_9BACT
MSSRPQVGENFVQSALGVDRNLSTAASLTIVIHGVGKATSQSILAAASKGYFVSQFSDVSQRIPLPDCPTLSGKRDAEALFLQGSAGNHFVIALPWTDRKYRLSPIAAFCGKVLLQVTVVMLVAFAARDHLQNLEDWLNSSWWSRGIFGYVTIVGLWNIWKNITSEPSERLPNWGYWVFASPFLLTIGLKIFLFFHILLLVPIGILIVALLLVACISIVRCLPLARSFGWKVSLLALVIALSLPAASLVGIVCQVGSRFASPPETQEQVERRAAMLNTSQILGPDTPPPQAPLRPASHAQKVKEKFADRYESLRDHWRDFIPSLAVAGICLHSRNLI